jgi:hypothetical protein
MRLSGVGVKLSNGSEIRTQKMSAPEGWDTSTSGGLAVNPLVSWDLIGTTDGMNAVLRLEFAMNAKERESIQLIIATPTFRELAETFIRFAGKLEATIAEDKPPGPAN